MSKEEKTKIAKQEVQEAIRQTWDDSEIEERKEILEDYKQFNSNEITKYSKSKWEDLPKEFKRTVEEGIEELEETPRKVSIQELLDLEINALLYLRSINYSTIGYRSLPVELGVLDDKVFHYVTINLMDKGYIDTTNGYSITLEGVVFIHRKKLFRLNGFDLAVLDLFDNDTEKILSHDEIVRIARERFRNYFVKRQFEYSLPLLVRINYLKATKRRKKISYSITQLGIQAFKNQESELDYSEEGSLWLMPIILKSGKYKVKTKT